MKESSRKSIEFVNLEEAEGLKAPSPIISPTVSAPVSSQIANTVRRTPQIGLVQQEIYDYIEYLEKRVTENAMASSSNKEK